MSTTSRPVAPSAAPPLVAGRRLDQATFHALYEAMPPGTRAELIGGVVYMASPASFDHFKASGRLVVAFGRYCESTPGVEFGDNASTILNDEAEPQPDAVLFVLPEYGGRIRITSGFITGAPELVAEVSKTTRFIDLGPKRAEYERAGVLEYVVRAYEPDEVIWHVLQEGNLVRIPPDADGLYRSRVFPGLWLDPQTLLANDLRGLRATVERGLASPEHQAFVARLAAARSSSRG
jgi:Uma2 family endonuclease